MHERWAATQRSLGLVAQRLRRLRLEHGSEALRGVRPQQPNVVGGQPLHRQPLQVVPLEILRGVGGTDLHDAHTCVCVWWGWMDWGGSGEGAGGRGARQRWRCGAAKVVLLADVQSAMQLQAAVQQARGGAATLAPSISFCCVSCASQVLASPMGSSSRKCRSTREASAL